MGNNLRQHVRQDLASILRGIDAELNRIGNEMVRDVVDYIEENRLEVQGDLKKGITYQVDYANGAFTLRMGGTAKHTYFVEEGRRPGKFPPVRKMQLWVQRKLNIKGKQRNRVAFLVGRKISKSGTKAHRMINATWQDYRDEIQSRVDNAVAAALN